MHVSLYRLWFGDIATDGKKYIWNCVKFSILHNKHIGGTVVQWITMSPHSKNVPGLDPVSAGVFLCGVCPGKVFSEHFGFLPQSSWVQLGHANVWVWMVVAGDTGDLYRLFTGYWPSPSLHTWRRRWNAGVSWDMWLSVRRNREDLWVLHHLNVHLSQLSQKPEIRAGAGKPPSNHDCDRARCSTCIFFIFKPEFNLAWFCLKRSPYRLWKAVFLIFPRILFFQMKKLLLATHCSPSSWNQCAVSHDLWVAYVFCSHAYTLKSQHRCSYVKARVFT